jgi:hypothetical protein
MLIFVVLLLLASCHALKLLRSLSGPRDELSVSEKRVEIGARIKNPNGTRKLAFALEQAPAGVQLSVQSTFEKQTLWSRLRFHDVRAIC